MAEAIADAEKDPDLILPVLTLVTELDQILIEAPAVFLLGDDQEFIAAIAVAEIVSPGEGFFHEVAGGLEDLIAQRVTVIVVELLEGIQIDHGDADISSDEGVEVFPETGPVSKAGQGIGPAVLIEFGSLLFYEVLVLLHTKEVPVADAVNEGADQMQGGKIHQILPGQKNITEIKNQNDAQDIDHHIPDVLSEIQIENQVDHNRHQNVFKEEAAALLCCQKGQGRKSHVDSCKPVDQSFGCSLLFPLHDPDFTIEKKQEHKIGNQNDRIDQGRIQIGKHSTFRKRCIGPDKPDQGNDTENDRCCPAEGQVIRRKLSLKPGAFLKFLQI